MRCRRAIRLVLALLPALPGAATAEELVGFSAASARRQLDYEARLAAEISAERIGRHLEWLSARPHRPGSEGARVTAEYLHQRLAEYGFQVETERYVGYLPAPVAVSLELLEPVEEALPTTEPPVEGDPFAAQAADHPGWSGYSPSGEATGHVVYGGYGSEAELQRLAEMGVDLRGRVLLLRNFGTGEGRKVRNVERFGAAGVVLYTDPAEDGYPFGDVYPDGNWRPPGSIMRRSIAFLPWEGDPLSPGWASVPGARRLDPAEVPLPAIPVLPVSYETARRLLAHLGGPVAPPDMQGALPLTYRLGPGPAKVRIRTQMDNRDRPMLDVVGRLAGESEPDQWVLAGNHHDAWIFGAGDPSSGTAALLELARAAGELARQGLRPRRTLVVAFWDAEEMVLGGSTEWVEEHAAELLEKAVAAINMDSAVFNPDRALSVAAHPTLHALFRSVARAVPDPRAGRSTWEVWRDLQNRYRLVPGVDGWGEFFGPYLEPGRELAEPWVFEVPYDDAAPFFHLLALPASDMYYGADYGMYHSIYENYRWMTTVVDPGFSYHRVMALIQGLAALRLANADLVPLDYAGEARWWRLALEDLAAVAARRGQEVPRLARLAELIDQWETAATALAVEAAALLADETRATAVAGALPAVSRMLAQAARDFQRPEGRPGAIHERNLFAGSSYEFEAVSGSTLPGLRFALDKGDLETAAREADLHVAALERRLATLEAIRQRLGGLR